MVKVVFAEYLSLDSSCPGALPDNFNMKIDKGVTPIEVGGLTFSCNEISLYVAVCC
jgi:hypothetical protein